MDCGNQMIVLYLTLLAVLFRVPCNEACARSPRYRNEVYCPENNALGGGECVIEYFAQPASRTPVIEASVMEGCPLELRADFSTSPRKELPYSLVHEDNRAGQRLYRMWRSRPHQPYTWTRDGRVFSEYNQAERRVFEFLGDRLKIRWATRDDEGTYMCAFYPQLSRPVMDPSVSYVGLTFGAAVRVKVLPRSSDWCSVPHSTTTPAPRRLSTTQATSSTSSRITTSSTATTVLTTGSLLTTVFQLLRTTHSPGPVSTQSFLPVNRSGIQSMNHPAVVTIPARALPSTFSPNSWQREVNATAALTTVVTALVGNSTSVVRTASSSPSTILHGPPKPVTNSTAVDRGSHIADTFLWSDYNRLNSTAVNLTSDAGPMLPSAMMADHADTGTPLPIVSCPNTSISTANTAAVAETVNSSSLSPTTDEKQPDFSHSYPGTVTDSPLSSTSAADLMATIAPAMPTTDAEETEEVTEFDWVPSDQRRHTMYPPECPACTGNCPCPPSKRKRKHL
ncbi:mucin-5AC-like [Paramacrobiotus metropolitanus]|uniref:mucin-5AC-like n=1 Tax=Paramacrobiotus metropolitanus TaxID=2943436 RepID=UPI002445EF3F|nr:mucin-5AC-like [Paramacrobiotus metropolitanus]